MKDIFWNFYIDDGVDSGLKLIEAPTGSGKTTAALEFLKQLIENHKNDKVFFMTNRIANLPNNNTLIKHLGKENLDKCLTIPAQKDSVLDFVTKGKLPNFSDDKEFKNIKEAFIKIQNLDKDFKSNKIKDQKYLKEQEKKYDEEINKQIY